MNRRGLAAFVCLLAGCSDPICPADVFIAIQTSEVSTDDDTSVSGVQTDVRVRTSLIEGDVTLEVLSGTQLVTTLTAPVDARGVAVFEHVTVPNPEATLRASFSVECGDAQDELVVPVTAGTTCDLIISPAPEDNAFYAPARVLNANSDTDPAAGYQATLVIGTQQNFTVEVFENVGTGDHSIGIFQAGAGGSVEMPYTLEDGHHTYRALCTNGALAAVSPTVDVVIDTTPPSCNFSIPTPGTTITPAFDDDLDLSNGIQMFVAGQVTGDDVSGEPTTLSIGELGNQPTAVVSTAIDGNGRAGGSISLVPATTPATFSFVFGARDHARNTCTAVETYDVVYDACDLVVTAPTSIVTDDADTTAANGSQLDVSLLVSSACIGQTVTSSCGTNNPSGVVPSSGQLTLRVDWCATSPCELTADCSFSVTSGSGIATSTGTTIAFDDQGPATTVAIVSPALACSSIVTPDADTQPAVEGVQVDVRVTAPDAATLSLEHTAAPGTTTLSATADVTITLEPGLNTLVGISSDALGNITRSSSCNVTLEGLAVAFSPPAADGTVERTDGVVTGNNLTFPLCGTVNVADTPVTLAIDGAAPVPTTVTGTTWCRTITLKKSPPSHTIVASATAGSSTASATLVLTVDLHP